MIISSAVLLRNCVNDSTRYLTKTRSIKYQVPLSELLTASFIAVGENFILIILLLSK